MSVKVDPLLLGELNEILEFYDENINILSKHVRLYLLL